ncbi:hypothetical protein [Enterococcus avium]|uniref:hypothetical protein n=1 Tax=Enterococcus avium TaxID=33945 RepID=UPI003463687D
MDAKSGYLVQGLKNNWIGKIILLTVLFGVFRQIKSAARPSFLDSLRLFFFGYQSEFTEKTNSISKRIRMSVQLFAGYLKQKDIKQ